VIPSGCTNAAGDRMASQRLALRLVIVPGVAVVPRFGGLDNSEIVTRTFEKYKSYSHLPKCRETRYNPYQDEAWLLIWDTFQFVPIPDTT
jgi:hypothetical protein